ncbi:MAG TPA: M15 family metallopeptidase [Lacunisphaera sp.]
MSTPLRKIWKSLGIPADYPRRRHLPVQRVARSLVFIGPAADDGQPLKLAPRAAQAWRRMQAAAAADRVRLLPLSGYRSVARQTRLIRRKLANGQSLESILQYVAAPGCSEHHTGRAIDIGSPDELELKDTFDRTAEYRWLRRHAGRFGFRLSYPRNNPHGIGYEPWHWCWHARKP